MASFKIITRKEWKDGEYWSKISSSAHFGTASTSSYIMISSTEDLGGGVDISKEVYDILNTAHQDLVQACWDAAEKQYKRRF